MGFRYLEGTDCLCVRMAFLGVNMSKTLLCLLLPTITFAAEISGSSSMKVVRFGEEGSPMRVEFKVDGAKLTGGYERLKDRRHV